MKNLFLVPLFFPILLPNYVFSLQLNLGYPQFGGIDLNRVADGAEAGALLVRYIYNALIALSGLAAFVMIIRAGVLWATARDNVGQVKRLKIF